MPQPDLAKFAVTGSIAGLAQVVTMASGHPPWIVFLAWVSYSTAPESSAPGLQTWTSFLVGAAAGCMVAMIVATVPAPTTVVLPFTLAIAVGLIALLDRAPLLNAVPVYYAGMISFFASGAPPGASILMTVAPPAAVGVCCGWLSNTLTRRLMSQPSTERR